MVVLPEIPVQAAIARVRPDDHVVPDLDLVVQLGAVLDHRVADGAAIDRGIRADLHIVPDPHAADLRHLHPSAAVGCKAESVGADDGPGMQHAALARAPPRDTELTRATSRVSAPTVAPRWTMHPGPIVGALADLGVILDHRKRTHRGRSRDPRARRDHGARMHPGADWAPDASARRSAHSSSRDSGRSAPRPGTRRASAADEHHGARACVVCTGSSGIANSRGSSGARASPATMSRRATPGSRDPPAAPDRTVPPAPRGYSPAAPARIQRGRISRLFRLRRRRVLAGAGVEAAAGGVRGLAGQHGSTLAVMSSGGLA